MGKERRTDATISQGKQHFSHPHILKLVKPAQGQTLTCNACDQKQINNKLNFHGCNSCQYFLHENCLNAPRFLDHSSHQSHHLTLLPTPTYSNRSYTCKACGSAGSAFSFSCARCEFDIHLQCALLPQTVLLPQHHHELELIFDSPFDHEDENNIFYCDVCQGEADHNYWLYYCADCDFGAHLKCGISKSVLSKQERETGNKERANPIIIMTPKEEPIMKEETYQEEEEGEDEGEEEDKEEDGEVELEEDEKEDELEEEGDEEGGETEEEEEEEEAEEMEEEKEEKEEAAETVDEEEEEKEEELEEEDEEGRETEETTETEEEEEEAAGIEDEDKEEQKQEDEEKEEDTKEERLQIPRSILIDKHPHKLKLYFCSPYEDKDTEFDCDICKTMMNKDDCLYYCAKCDFGSHLQCASSPGKPNTYPNSSPINRTAEMINSANEAHEALMAAQLESMIAARSRQAMLDSVDGPSRRYYYY